MIRSILFVLFSVIVQNLSFGQKFDAHIALGLNASQIDGDLFSGYSKLGIHGGLGIAYPLDDTWSIESGLHYDALGSQKNLQIGNSSPEEQQKIQLTYLSFPLTAQYTMASIPLTISTGIQISQLIDSRIQDGADDTILDFFSKTDIAALLKADYRFAERWSISIKASEAITLIFNNNKVSEINSNSLRNKYLTFSFNRHL